MKKLLLLSIFAIASLTSCSTDDTIIYECETCQCEPQTITYEVAVDTQDNLIKVFNVYNAWVHNYDWDNNGGSLNEYGLAVRRIGMSEFEFISEIYPIQSVTALEGTLNYQTFFVDEDNLIYDITYDFEKPNLQQQHFDHTDIVKFSITVQVPNN